MVYIYLHLVDLYGFHVGQYTSPMDRMGNGQTPYWATNTLDENLSSPSKVWKMQPETSK